MLTPMQQHRIEEYGHASATAEARIMRGTYPLSRATRNSGGILFQAYLRCNSYFTVERYLSERTKWLPGLAISWPERQRGHSKAS